MSTIEQLLQELYHALDQTLKVNYTRAGALAFLVYDICLMFSDEVEFIWTTRWSLPKACYYFARYYGLVYNLITFGLLRLHALYQKDKKVLGFLLFIFLGELAATLYISIKAGILAADNQMFIPFGIAFPGCLASVPTSFTLAAWIPSLVCAAIFFIMTIIKAVQALADVDGNIPWRKLRLDSLSPLYLAFIQSGAMYYCIVTAGLLVALLTTILVTGPMENVAQAWLIATYSYAGSRLVLTFRQSTLRTEEGTGGSIKLHTFKAARPGATSSEVSSNTTSNTTNQPQHRSFFASV
ncbi:hypothetical protein C8J56DRAFT_1060461 [Mycena floridula]|nr:hypothetical protein C8J56DRAFT_1060461 [Mycena floridula]